MTLVDFIKKYFGKKVDFDGVYGAQCVDLFRQYCKDVLEIPHTGAVEGAKDLFLNYDKLTPEKKYFKKIKPEELTFGDVVIYDKTKTNSYGHVAIVIFKYNDKQILVFEQNGFTQNGAEFAVRTLDCLGGLRFKTV